MAARNVLRRRLRVLALVYDAYRKLHRRESAVSHVKADLVQLFRLTHAWARREYMSVPWRSLLCAVAAIVYFVSPFDLIPDALVGIGFVDDVAVISAVVRAIKRDLDDFRTWELGSAQTSLTESFRAAA